MGRQLPTKLVIASAEDGSTSLKLKVELKTTDKGEVKSVNSFVDSGATGEFIDHHYAKSNQLHTRKLSKPIPVYNVDGTLNEAGSLYFTVPHLSPVDSSGLHQTPLDSAFKGRKYTAGLTPVQWTLDL